MASSGSRSRYVDPDHVFELVVNRKPRDLFDYLNSIPGASEDLQCRMIIFAGMALLVPRPRLRSLPPLPDEDLWALSWAKYAWVHAINSRLCAPQMVGNPINFASNPGHYMHPLNSSSYSGRMLTTHIPGSKVLRIAAMFNQGSASNSRIPTATFPPLQANSNDVINFLIIPAGTLNQTSTFNSGTCASAFVPFRANSTVAPAVGELSLRQPEVEQLAPQEQMQNTVSPQELEQSNNGTPAVGVLTVRRPGSEKITPQELMQNAEVLSTVDSKGKRPASEVLHQEEKILRLNVASSIAQGGAKGAAGVLIRSGSSGTGQFFCASCFPIPGTEPALVFAAACCEGIKIAQVYQPTTVVLESHLFHLLNQLLAARIPQPEIEEFKALLKPPHCIAGSIPEESNCAARQLAMRGLQMGVPLILFDAPPDWLVLT